MKSYFYSFSLLILLLVSSCSKSDTNPPQDKIMYEVITSGGTWLGSYYAYFGNKNWQASDNLYHQPSGWTYTFYLSKSDKHTLLLNGYAEDGGSLSLKIYVNNKLVTNFYGNEGQAYFLH